MTTKEILSVIPMFLSMFAIVVFIAILEAETRRFDRETKKEKAAEAEKRGALA